MNVLLLCCLSAALFDVRTIPLHTPDAHVFLAHADRDTRADVFILEPGQASIFFSQRDAVRTIPLPEDTTAVDIADLDDDGQPEIVAVSGNRILSIRLDAEVLPPPRELFSLHTQLANAGATPYPFVLTMRRDNKTLLALPCEETFELRTPDGAIVTSYPIGEDAPRRASYGAPFRAWTCEPPLLGAKDALEGAISRSVAFEPDLPAELSGPSTAALSLRRGTPLQTREAASQDIESWPWFPLALDGSGDMRVFYTLAPPDFRDSVVRIRGFARKSETGPERRYPGSLIIMDDDLPDFNHDGFADLLLWSAPEPGMSLDAATRALTAGSWPVNLSAHLFSPEKGRYEPVCAGTVACTAPIAWFLAPEASGPLHHCVLRDFDGDGCTDIACATAPNRFHVWRFTHSGTATTPAYSQTFPEPITEITFKADLSGNGKTSLGLRTEHDLYVLFAIGGES